MPLLFVGALRDASSTPGAARVDGRVVKRLLPVDATTQPRPQGSTSSNAPRAPTSSAAAAAVTTALPALRARPSSAYVEDVGASTSQALPPQKRQRPRSQRLTYYVCTRTDCGWTGSRPKDHWKAKRNCPGYPSTVNFDQGQQTAKEAAKEFLERCTPRQRALGFPPDYCKPVPLPSENGVVDLNKLYLTVPIGLKAGDSFEVPMARGYRAALVVPEGRSEGDVMWVYANAGVLRAGDDGDSNGERLALE